jgi:hypothetical protein
MCLVQVIILFQTVRIRSSEYKKDIWARQADMIPQDIE